MTKILSLEEVEKWNQSHQEQAYAIIICLNLERKIAEYIVDGYDVHILPFSEAFSYFEA